MSIEVSRAGMDTAQARMFRSARRIAHGSAQRPGLTENITAEAVEQSIAEASFEVNGRMIQAQNEMTGSLLDILA